MLQCVHFGDKVMLKFQFHKNTLIHSFLHEFFNGLVIVVFSILMIPYVPTSFKETFFFHIVLCSNYPLYTPLLYYTDYHFEKVLFFKKMFIFQCISLLSYSLLML